jgi:hypothetical protein
LHVTLSPLVALLIGFSSDLLAEKLKDLASSTIPFTTTDASLKNEPGPTADQQNKPAQQLDTKQPAIDQMNVGDQAKLTQNVEQLQQNQPSNNGANGAPIV